MNRLSTRTAPRYGKASAMVTPIAGALAVAAGTVILLGWLLDIGELRGLVPGQVTVKANTALGVVLAGIVLLLARRGASPVARLLRLVCEILLLLLGLLTLAEYAFDVDLSLDELLADAPSSALMTGAPGRMSPTSALAFIYFAIAMIIDHRQSGIARGWSRAFATMLLILGLTSLLGYMYGAPLLYLGVEGVTATSMPAAILFVVLATGAIWLRSGYGFPAMLVEPSVVGAHMRALLPMVVAAPLLVGALVASGYGTLYEGQFAIALTSLGSVVAAGLVAVVSITVLRRAEDELYLKDRALQATSNGVLITDHRRPDEPIVFANAAFLNMTGYAVDECTGRNCRFLNHGVDNDPAILAQLRECLRKNTEGTFELRNRRRDGSLFWNRLSLAPVEDYEGDVTHFVGIVDDITGRRQQEAELQNAYDDATSANAMRDMFVRLVSHELRTPLNAALTWIRLMEVDDSEPTRSKGMGVVANSIESQSRLIDDLVDVSRLAATQVHLEIETVDTRPMIEGVVEELRPGIESEQSISLSVDEGDFVARVDPVRVQQIVRNLISNASKYTPEGGRIDIRLQISNGLLQLTVADTGKGLTEEEQRRIFEPFWRADSHKPGLGVGLFIASALAEAHGGTVQASSDGPGKGSTFELRLPLRGPGPDAADSGSGERLDGTDDRGIS